MALRPMRRRSESRLLPVIAVVALGAATSRGAEPVPVAVDYRAEPGCPSEGEFLGEIRARTGRVRLVQTAEAGRAFRATIVRVGPAHVGYLEVVDPDGTSSVREIKGQHCGETASALAFMLAVAADPEAAAVAGPVPDHSRSFPNAPVPPASTGVAPRVELQPAAPRGGPDARTRPSLAPSPVRRANVALGLGAGPWLGGGVAPEVCLGGRLFLELARARETVASPSVRVELGLLDNGPFGGAERRASFRWLGGRLSACAVAAVAARTWSVAPCVVVDGGTLEGSGRMVAHPKARAAGWASAGLSGRLTWWGGRNWFLEADGAVMIPFFRPEFVFDHPRIYVFQVPWVVGTVGAAAGVRLF